MLEQYHYAANHYIPYLSTCLNNPIIQLSYHYIPYLSTCLNNPIIQLTITSPIWAHAWTVPLCSKPLHSLSEHMLEQSYYSAKLPLHSLSEHMLEQSHYSTKLPLHPLSEHMLEQYHYAANHYIPYLSTCLNNTIIRPNHYIPYLSTRTNNPIIQLTITFPIWAHVWTNLNFSWENM